MSHPYYDNYVVANKTIQERLGIAPNEINKNSGAYSMQARSLLQMLSYGLDSITGRAATHLLNFDIFHANDAYLMKLCEGLLLNSIESITPPRVVPPTYFEFDSEKEYHKYSTIGTVVLDNSASTNLVIYKEPLVDESNKVGNETRYKVRYCAGEYVQQSISTSDLDFSVGTFQSVYISETYKSIWTESVEITLKDRVEGSGGDVALQPVWSMTELLAYPDKSNLVFCQHTSRGITIILGDGELYGSNYKDRYEFSSLEIVYIKMEFLANPKHETLSFNDDIIQISPIPVMAALHTGDTPESLRGRSIQQLFANGKITDEVDLVTELNRIPVVKSCAARREYNVTPGLNTWNKNTAYSKGTLVIYPAGGNVYVATSDVSKNKSAPNSNSSWLKIYNAAVSDLGKVNEGSYRYDNATIVLSGLLVSNRFYYDPTRTYKEGDIVYHRKTDALYRCVNPNGAAQEEEPGDDDGDIGESTWVSEEDLLSLSSDHPLYHYIIEDYEPISQASYDLELRTYFGIWRKLGFTSVVVTPVKDKKVSVTCSYSTVVDISQRMQRTIRDYVCYNVGKELLASELHSKLTEEFGLTKVYVKFGNSDSVSLGIDEYVSRKNLSIDLKLI